MLPTRRESNPAVKVSQYVPQPDSCSAARLWPKTTFVMSPSLPGFHNHMGVWLTGVAPLADGKFGAMHRLERLTRPLAPERLSRLRHQRELVGYPRGAIVKGTTSGP
jgi:hypothetical protein